MRGEHRRAWGVGREQWVNPQDTTSGELWRTPALSTVSRSEVNAKSPICTSLWVSTSANMAPAEAAGPRPGEPSDAHTRPRHSTVFYLEIALKYLAVSGEFTTAGCLTDLSSASQEILFQDIVLQYCEVL